MVFSCLNSAYKIEADVFTAWMRTLTRVPESVLWLLHTHQYTENNLVLQAKKSGVDKTRIIFVPTLPKREHLQRLSKSDLALDTTPVNGHTTTVDCLWAGVPVITTIGTHFASRVSASCLKAVGLPQLITSNLSQYENLAVDLATHPQKLLRLKSRLRQQIKSCPLFDTKQYTRNLEMAFFQMHHAL
ncbi:hypothetical protein A3D85_00650 [Candidatus Amesbacteria bacterium RIFCSPHIGHO2_02_FULL_47_9]|uniref:O-GlcNAc transferase C-terminal domain-containing protein n=1 Tax=Candidatus Amesbacteria bacterium RIFCSPHIGHO2_01_FULL_48_32b TaxID=1797253 RepID=A0A1F4YF11_9BACT|nr:MAG: hypothetical protein A2876_02140 [Candidatus Amesbacteria bacterium RIFCSPHIGHO2_01_FULL_48_32b]OGD02661.1 MAG: hypothetical protein A3D85_00650 [Candidatus Amesbacteria bacterium RIFCSPHIGHO2_02_FULL_47_9]OGD06939.1 MAG: hypothetical protein A2899_03520 [Candidatus Amesbacteria bacterium RIFCSPLOWO2_01_FULL_49_25]